MLWGDARKGETKAWWQFLEFLMKNFPRATIVSAKFIVREKLFHPRTFQDLWRRFHLNFFGCRKTFSFIHEHQRVCALIDGIRATEFVLERQKSASTKKFVV